jgi:hypothetical protein
MNHVSSLSRFQQVGAIPILIGYTADSMLGARLIVYCPWCHDWHSHSDGESPLRLAGCEVPGADDKKYFIVPEAAAPYELVDDIAAGKGRPPEQYGLLASINTKSSCALPRCVIDGCSYPNALPLRGVMNAARVSMLFSQELQNSPDWQSSCERQFSYWQANGEANQ